MTIKSTSRLSLSKYSGLTINVKLSSLGRIQKGGVAKKAANHYETTTSFMHGSALGVATCV